MVGLLQAAISVGVASALPLQPRSVVVGFNVLRSRDDSYVEYSNIAKNLAPLILGDGVDHEFKELSTWDKGQAGLGNSEAWIRADVDLQRGRYCDDHEWHPPAPSHRSKHRLDLEGCLDWCRGHTYCTFDHANQSGAGNRTCGRGNECGWRRKEDGSLRSLRVYKWQQAPAIDIFIGIGWFLQDDAYKSLRTHSPPFHWTENDRLLGVPLTERTRSFKAKGRPFVITWDNEVFFSPDAQKYDVLLTTTQKCAEVCENSLLVPFPYAMTSMLARSRHTWRDLLKPGTEVSPAAPKEKFCAFLQGGMLLGGRPGGCVKDCYRPDAAVRVAFYDVLAEQYKRCTAFSGHCREQPGDPSVPPTRAGETLYDSQVTLYEPYKFVISMENSGAEGYVTEKIISAALAGAVPIYFGAPDVGAWVNPERFINCNIDVGELRNMNFPDFSTPGSGKDEPFEKAVKWVKKRYASELTACVGQVRHLDTDDSAYEAVRSQPIVVEGSRLNFTATGKMLGHVYRKLRSD